MQKDQNMATSVQFSVEWTRGQMLKESGTEEVCDPKDHNSGLKTGLLFLSTMTSGNCMQGGTLKKLLHGMVNGFIVDMRELPEASRRLQSRDRK